MEQAVKSAGSGELLGSAAEDSLGFARKNNITSKVQYVLIESYMIILYFT